MVTRDVTYKVKCIVAPLNKNGSLQIVYEKGNVFQLSKGGNEYSADPGDYFHTPDLAAKLRQFHIALLEQHGVLTDYTLLQIKNGRYTSKRARRLKRLNCLQHKGTMDLSNAYTKDDKKLIL